MPFLDHLPAGQYHQHRDEGIQQDEENGNTIHAQEVLNVEARNPWRQLDELHANVSTIEAGVKRQRDKEASDGYRQ